MAKHNNLERLKAMREEFRKSRPDLSLPPAWHAEAERESELKKEEIRRKFEEVRKTAREDPKKIAKLIKRYTDNA